MTFILVDCSGGQEVSEQLYLISQDGLGQWTSSVAAGKRQLLYFK